MVLGTSLWSLFIRGNLNLEATLRERGVTTTATVVRTDPDNHDSIRYSYIVDGRTYEKQSGADAPNPGADQLSAGDPVTITYDARDPRTSCACTPREEWQGWGLVLFGGVSLGGFFLVVVASAITSCRQPSGGCAFAISSRNSAGNHAP
jgi:hypothetical protein